MNSDIHEGTLAAQVRSLHVIEPDTVWEGARRSLGRTSSLRRPFQVRRRHRLTLAVVAAVALALLGSTALAVGLLTRPAFVFGKPVTQPSGNGYAAHMGWPGHPIQTSIEQASELAGFRVLTLDPMNGVTLNSVTYVPKVVPASQPAPTTGGSVSLDYTIEGTEVRINEALDPHPSTPLVLDQKVAPGYTGPLCTSVETIDGGQYIFVRCPDGKTIVSVFWKTLNGLDISLLPISTASSAPKSTPPPGLTMPVIGAVIAHLR